MVVHFFAEKIQRKIGYIIMEQYGTIIKSLLHNDLRCSKLRNKTERRGTTLKNYDETEEKVIKSSR